MCGCGEPYELDLIGHVPVSMAGPHGRTGVKSRFGQLLGGFQRVGHANAEADERHIRTHEFRYRPGQQRVVHQLDGPDQGKDVDREQEKDCRCHEYPCNRAI